MKKISMIFKTIYSFKTIYELKDTKLIKSVGVLIIYTLFLNFGLALSIISTNTLSPTMVSKTIYEDVPESFLPSIPNCLINKDLLLICESDDIFIQEFKDFTFVVSANKNFDYINNNKTNIVFFKESIEIYQKDENVTYSLNYKHFRNVDFKHYKISQKEEVIDDIFNRLYISIKPQILTPVLLFVYGTVILLNFLLIFGLAAFALLLNIGNRKMSLKQFFNIAIYSSILPTLLSFFISLIISPIFGVVIYNFSLSIYFIYVYKNVIKGNFSH